MVYVRNDDNLQYQQIFQSGFDLNAEQRQHCLHAQLLHTCNGKENDKPLIALLK